MTDAAVDEWTTGQFARLEDIVEAGFAPLLARAVRRLWTHGRRLALINISDTTVLQVAPRARPSSHSTVQQYIGFPFPVAMRKRPAGVDTRGYVVYLHAHLRQVRDHQRQLLHAALRQGEPSRPTWHEMPPAPFARRVAEALRRPVDLLYYHDPFRFTGDSVGHLTCRTRFAPLVHARRTLSTTCHPPVDGYDGMAFLPPAALTAWLRRLRARTVFAVLPDFIDDQWPITVEIVRALTSTVDDLAIVIPGRNLLVERRPEWGDTRVAHLAADDVVLWDHPVEALVDASVARFVPGSLPPLTAPPRTRAAGQRRVFIHPITSSASKDLPVRLVAAIVRDLASRFGSSVEVMVGGGVRGDARHVAWRRRYARHTRATRRPTFSLVDTLPELAREIETSSLVVTADTAVGHLARAAGTPNIVLYNRIWWDPFSRGSLFHHSPLGFCGASPCQIPCVIDTRTLRAHAMPVVDLATSIGSCAQFFLEPPARSVRLIDALTTCAERLLALAAVGSGRGGVGSYGALMRAFRRTSGGTDRATSWITDWWDAAELTGHLAAGEAPAAARQVLSRRFLQLAPARKAALNTDAYT